MICYVHLVVHLFFTVYLLNQLTFNLDIFMFVVREFRDYRAKSQGSNLQKPPILGCE